MCKIIHFGSFMPKTAGDARYPLLARASLRTKKYFVGMERLDGHPLTVERAVAVNLVTASGPPRARMISAGVSNVVSMSEYTSQNAKIVNVENPPSVGERLRWCREALALTQKEMAKLCGVSEGNYSQFESNSRRISLNAALRLSERAQITLDWIYKGRGVPLDRYQFRDIG